MALATPLRSQILAKGSELYEISDEDNASIPKYYGYLNTSGLWIIQQYNETTGAYRYFQGRSDYSTNWTNRASLSYGLYSTLANLV